MSAPIVVGFDPRAPDEAPVRFGLAAARFTGAPVIVVAVERGGSPLHRHASGELEDAQSPESREALDRVRALVAAEEGVTADVRILEDHSAARGLHRAIDDEGAALVVVGATSAGAAGRALVGSTAERVVHGSPCAVAVVPQGFEGAGLHSIGVAYTASPEGEEALKAAAGLAARAGDAKLRVITVLHEEAGTLASPRRGERAAEVLPEEIAAHHNLSARAALDDALSGAGAVEAETELVYGDPAEALLGFTTTLDLLVMGSRAYGPRRAVMLGGVSRKVTAAARCPVIVLPRGAERSLGDLVSA
jgi:nucleotide-binding universal stress UspA family protein